MTQKSSQSSGPDTASAISADDKGVTVLGIDPGLDGALAVVNSKTGIVTIVDMPTNEMLRNGKRKREIDASYLAYLLGAPEVAPVKDVYVELVNASPQMGVTSAFTFGEGKGVLRGVLAAMGFSITYVTPQVWQRAMRVRKGKDASRARAAELFPHSAGEFRRVKDHGRADAALIAAWGLATISPGKDPESHE